MLFVASLMIIKPGGYTDLIGFALLALVYLSQRWRMGRQPPAPPAALAGA